MGGVFELPQHRNRIRDTTNSTHGDASTDIAQDIISNKVLSFSSGPEPLRSGVCMQKIA